MSAKKEKRKQLKKQKQQQAKNKTQQWWKDGKILPYLAAILAITAIIYFPSLNNEFVNWDDDLYITDNVKVVHLNAESIKSFFTEAIAANYHPITMLSLAIDYQLVGQNPSWYRAVNILLHLLNTILVFYFAYVISGRKKEIGLITALLFAVHPMHVESVVWIAERKDVLYTFFFMISLIYYASYLELKEQKNLILAFVFFVLSVLSKPAAVVLPLVLLLLDYWYDRKFEAKQMLEKVPFFILSLIIGIATINIQADSAIGDLENHDFIHRIAFASYGFVMYIIKVVFPFKLAALHPYPSVTNGLPMLYMLMPLAALAILVGVFWSKKYTKVAVFGFLFFIINVILVLQFVSVGMAIMSERYTYVPYIGLFFALAYGLYYLLNNETKIPRNAVLGALGVYVAILCLLSFDRTKVWQNTEKLWTDVIEKYPNKAPIAHNNRGTYYRSNKKYDAALADFNKAISLKSDYHLAYNNRGNVYFNQRKFEQAAADYTKVLEIKPDNEKAYGNRGGVYIEQKKYDLAEKDLTKAIEIDPFYLDAYMNRGVLYSMTNRFDLAKKDYDSYIKYRNNNAMIYHWRGIAQQQTGQHQAATQDFSKAIQLNGKVADFYYQNAVSLSALGNKAAALQNAQKAKNLGMKVEDAFLQQLK